MTTVKLLSTTIAAIFIVVGMTACKKSSVFLSHAKPESTISAGDPRLASDLIHFSKDTVYVLAADLTRDAGQTLDIQAGTLIKVGDRLSIVINPGATLKAQGTATEPIVFTSSAYKGSQGLAVFGAGSSAHSWYGIRIYGPAAGSPSPAIPVLTYIRIEFAGNNVNGMDWPALLLQQVGKDAVLENIQVSYSIENPSFEFLNGDCNAYNLISYASAGTDFYMHGGYKGKQQDLLAYRLPYFASGGTSGRLAGLLLSDTNTLPVISNLTVLGPGIQSTLSSNYSQLPAAGLITTGKSGFHIRNSAIMGFPKAGWWLDDKTTATLIVDSASDLTFTLLHCNDSNLVFYMAPGTYQNFKSSDFKTYMLQPSFNNQVITNMNAFLLKDPFNYDIAPDPTPQPTSPLLKGAEFDGIYDDAFFKKVPYRGAIGLDNWLKDWTNFTPLQTNYNN